MAAGLAAGLGAVLSPETLLGEAAARARTPVPAQANLPIDTFVVLMMENRSFDHYLGWLPNADGRQGGLTYNDKQGRARTHRLDARLAGLRAPRPRPLVGRRPQQLNGGQMDGFLRSGEQRRLLDRLLRGGRPPFIPDAAASSPPSTASTAP